MTYENINLPKTRAEAQELGARLYSTGKPCKHGHVGPRFALDCHCVQCSREEGQRYYSRKKESWRLRAATPETRQYQAAYYQKHKAQFRYFENKTRAGSAMPPWLTSEQKAAIMSFYVEAQRRSKLTDILQAVDHIIPLVGISKETGEHDVCGLHVPWNLQIMTLADNTRKGSYHD